jgi:hypothetical protein
VHVPHASHSTVQHRIAHARTARIARIVRTARIASYCALHASRTLRTKTARIVHKHRTVSQHGTARIAHRCTTHRIYRIGIGIIARIAHVTRSASVHARIVAPHRHR